MAVRPATRRAALAADEDMRVNARVFIRRDEAQSAQLLQFREAFIEGTESILGPPFWGDYTELQNVD